MRDSPTVGVLLALMEALEDSEEELSARARGAGEGGLAPAVLGGLKGRTCGGTGQSAPLRPQRQLRRFNCESAIGRLLIQSNISL